MIYPLSVNFEKYQGRVYGHKNTDIVVLKRVIRQGKEL
jgi:hypothetical protein